MLKVSLILKLSLLTILFSCQNRDANIAVVSPTSSDSLKIKFADIRLENEIGIGFDYIRIRKIEKNKTARFTYYTNDTILIYDYKYDGNEKTIRMLNDKYEYSLTDTITSRFLSLTFYKYEKINPAIDGEGCIIIHPYLGIVATAAYSWAGKHIISNDNNIRLSDSLILSLYQENQSYFQYKFPNKPQPITNY